MLRKDERFGLRFSNSSLGATEPHNLHLPYLTDCILSHSVAVDAAERAKKEYGVRCMVMPPVTAGSQNPGQRERRFV